MKTECNKGMVIASSIHGFKSSKYLSSARPQPIPALSLRTYISRNDLWSDSLDTPNNQRNGQTLVGFQPVQQNRMDTHQAAIVGAVAGENIAHKEIF